MKTHGMGSLQNIMAANTAPAVPVVGMGATEILYTDRNPFTVVEVVDGGKRLVLQEDAVVWKPFPNGYAETITPNPDGHKVTVSLRKDGRYRRVGGTSIYNVGTRSAYRDPSF